MLESFIAFFNKKRIAVYLSFLVLSIAWTCLAFFISNRLSEGFVLMSKEEFELLLNVKEYGFYFVMSLSAIIMVAEGENWLE